jgi:hypothetical protein
MLVIDRVKPGVYSWSLSVMFTIQTVKNASNRFLNRSRGPAIRNPHQAQACRRMTLPEMITALYREGKLPKPFGVEDIGPQVRPLYSPTYLSVVLANYCESTGDYVIKGSRPRFRRVSRGRYEVIEN